MGTALLFPNLLHSIFPKSLYFSVKSNPGLDSKEIFVKKIEDTAKVIFSTDDSGEYTVTL